MRPSLAALLVVALVAAPAVALAGPAPPLLPSCVAAAVIQALPMTCSFVCPDGEYLALAMAGVLFSGGMTCRSPEGILSVGCTGNVACTVGPTGPFRCPVEVVCVGTCGASTNAPVGVTVIACRMVAAN